jgi:3-oxosteroid 1-dehydrogenase
MVDFLHERTRVRYMTLEHSPDYYTNLEGSMAGHRSMEPEPFPASELGEEWRNLRRTHQMMHLGGVIGITQIEAADMVVQAPGWWKFAAKLMLDYILDIPWRLKDRFHRRLATGCAGVARLRASLQDRDIPVWLNTSMKKLVDEDGKVIGVEVVRDGKPLRIQARKAVVLAAGGFEHNQAMREQYLPKPTDHRWSAGTMDNTGDAILEGQRLGAKMHRLDEAWWCNTISVPGEDIPRLSVMERSYPGSIIVNPAGKRFSNESQNYMAFQIETFAKHSQDNPTYPTWQIFDANFREKYFVGPLFNSKFRPDYMVPGKYEVSRGGFYARGETISELAAKIGVDVDGLEETVRNMNDYAKSGVDPECQRGESAYDRYYGDPSVEPNPCLGPVDTAPYYAVRIDPGDFGTQGGMVITGDARVVHEDGHVIEGLFACGNCSAPTLPCYPGPGSTLGPSMTFGYQAAKAITGYQD